MAISTAAAIVGAAAIGAGASMSASSKAAKAQGKAADQASATQLEMYHQSRNDQAPWRQVGGNALNELAMRLGIQGGGSSGTYSGGVGGTPGNSLAGATLVDTSSGAPRPNEELYGSNAAYRSAWDDILAIHQQAYKGRGYDNRSDAGWIEQGLRSRLAPQIAADAEAQREAVESNPLYGSLLKNFTAADFESDPIIQKGFQFGLDEGTKGLNRMAAANGGLDSGAQLKALTRYATDYTGTKGNEAFNRFNINRDATYNKLASLAGVGQQASQMIGTQAMQTGQGIAQNQIGVGNARAASAIGNANAVNSAIGQGWNMYQGNQLMNRYGWQANGSGSGYNPYNGYDASANGGWGIE